MECLPEPEKEKIEPGIEPNLLGKEDIALPLAPPATTSSSSFILRFYVGLCKVSLIIICVAAKPFKHSSIQLITAKTASINRLHFFSKAHFVRDKSRVIPT